MKKQGDNHEIFYCEGHNYGFENFIRLVILSLLNNSVLTLTMVLPNKTACTVCNQSILFTWNCENKNQEQKKYLSVLTITSLHLNLNDWKTRRAGAGIDPAKDNTIFPHFQSFPLFRQLQKFPLILQLIAQK